MSLKVHSRALSALQEFSELQRLRLSLASAGAAVYDWTLADDRIEWSDNTPSMLGAARFGAISTGLDLMASIDETFRPQVEEAIAQSAMSGEPFHLEYVMAPGGKEPIWVEDSGICLRDEKGNAVRVVGSLRNITERRSFEENLRYLASFDELTGHLNRVYLREALSAAIAEAEENGEAAAFLLVAIDHLSIVNEDYGFDVADEVIVAVGERIRETLRDCDVLGRAGGNKFGVVLPAANDQHLTAAAKNILSVMRASVVRTSRGPVSVTVSIGGVPLPACAKSSGEAMAHAEEALGAAKQLGRDSFRLFNPSARRESIRKQNISMADQIVRALEDDRILIAYQPILCTETGEITIHECLARMASPTGQILSAGHWVPVAERLGLVRHIDRRMAELALGVLKRVSDVSLALNISALTATDGEWLETFLRLIADVPEAASRLTVELTETLALRDLEESSRFISRLREAGCRVAIDDFGAGYTSFKNLQHLEVDMVKIDGTFIQRIHQSKDNQLFVRTLVSLARNFGVATVAEWVSDEADAEFLKTVGVDYLQGFLFGEPVIDPPFLKAR